MSLIFPTHGDPGFAEKLAALQEYQVFTMPNTGSIASTADYEKKVQQACVFEKNLYQHLMHHYLSYRSPYRSLLLYHGLGVGKTCSAITVAEGLINDVYPAKDRQRVWVVMSNALKDNFEGQVCDVAKLTAADTTERFKQCTQDTYRKWVTGTETDAELARKITDFVRMRYKFFTYDKFASEIKRLEEAGELEQVAQNKLLIVDEAHNLRVNETDKAAAAAVMRFAEVGVNNRIVLLSATPMYNEPDEILWLLKVLNMNDVKDAVRVPETLFAKNKTTLLDGAVAKLKQLCAEYVSYIRGTNPFTFAARFAPDKCGVPLLKLDWTASIRDGLVGTELGDVQQAALSSLGKADITQLQGANVCYPLSRGKFAIGDKGFAGVFSEVDDVKPIQVRYADANANAAILFPKENLPRYAAKIQRICDLVAKAEGVVLIYSQFVWSGVVPMAIALEHMGFQRYKSRGLLARPRLVEPPVSYPGIPFPTYCILSSDAKVMGDTNIKTLVKAINDPANIHGQEIKVIIITPVAGEGLSFKNVREVHVMDPWYHLNRLDQVIGRAIRNCSHTQLPIVERNVSVYLHTGTVAALGEAAPDLHAYKIAAGKAASMKKVEETIRDHAMDCALMRAINYTPKELFTFDIVMKTSQGNSVVHHFGDDISDMPRCKEPAAVPDESTMRMDAFVEIVPTVLQRLRKYIGFPPRALRYGRDELVRAMNLSAASPLSMVDVILAKACEPSALFKDYTMASHMNDFVLIPPVEKRMAKIVRMKPEEAAAEASDGEAAVGECMAIEEGVARIDTTDDSAAIVALYKLLTAKCWPVFAKRVIEYGRDLPAALVKNVARLTAEGAFIKATELPEIRWPATMPLVGFVDLFAANGEFVATKRNLKRDGYTDVTAAEVEQLKRKRKSHVFVKGSYDHVVATMETDKHGAFVVKLWEPLPDKGVKTTHRGLVCEFSKKPMLLKHVGALGVEADATATKEQLCSTLAVELHRKGRLYMQPYWK